MTVHTRQQLMAFAISATTTHHNTRIGEFGQSTNDDHRAAIQNMPANNSIKRASLTSRYLVRGVHMIHNSTQVEATCLQWTNPTDSQKQKHFRGHVSWIQSSSPRSITYASLMLKTNPHGTQFFHTECSSWELRLCVKGTVETLRVGCS